MSTRGPSAGQSYLQLNLYDIFANFLPGAYLLIGMFLPDWLLLEKFPTLSIFEAGGAVIMAFVAGFCTQSIGSYVQSENRPFDKFMPEGEDGSIGSENINDTNIDRMFCEICEGEFGIDPRDDDFSDWGRLYKLVIADIETGGQQRALRIQALHLSARGLLISACILVVFHFLRALFLIPLFPRGNPVIHLALVGVSILTIPIFYYRYKDFERDVVKYMIYDFVLEREQRYSDVVDGE